MLGVRNFNDAPCFDPIRSEERFEEHFDERGTPQDIAQTDNDERLSIWKRWDRLDFSY